ncbi:SA1788 family PVL leukocidin-associated protein, partial [Streptomyces sp. NPDC006627]|uniref:SA1788 family PVL leukocidin-associated protein n=1 Tax=Streptomyces sp. NPDC006627 TaxID=3154679 RepID=UPI0033A6F990
GGVSMETIDFKVKGIEYRLYPVHLKKMDEENIQLANVRTRLVDGWYLEDAVEAPVGMRRKEWLILKKDVVKKETLKEKLERYRTERLKRNKPHLFNVPQKHSRGKWCEYLMENDIFPKKVAR